MLSLVALLLRMQTGMVDIRPIKPSWDQKWLPGFQGILCMQAVGTDRNLPVGIK